MSRDKLLASVLLLGLVVIGVSLWRLDRRPGSEVDLVPPGRDLAERPRDEERPVRRDAAREPSPVEVPNAIAVEVEGVVRPPIEVEDDFGTPLAAISGRVHDFNLQPIPAATVELWLADGFGTGAARTERVGAAVSDEDGAVAFEDVVTHERYLLVVRHAEHATETCGPIELTPGRWSHYDLQVGGGLPLFGRVEEAATGAPLADAVVSVYDLTRLTAESADAIERRTQTGADGTYTCEALKPGVKRITVELAPWASGTETGFVLDRAESLRSHDFSLTRGLDVSGRVTDDLGRPVVNARVQARPVMMGDAPRAETFYPEVLSGAGGRYVIAGLLPGLYVVRAEGPAHQAGTVRLSDGREGRSARNAEAGDRDVDLSIIRAPVVRGHVFDALTGQPVRAFSVVASAQPFLIGTAGLDRRRFVDDDGAFTYPVGGNLSPQPQLWLFALAPGYGGGSTAVELVAPTEGQAGGRRRFEIDDVVIRLEPGGAFTGRVVGPDREPLRGVRVTAFPRLSNAGSALLPFAAHGRLGGTSAASDEDGRFRVANLRAGDYVLYFEHVAHAAVETARTSVDEGREIDVGLIELRAGARITGVVRDGEGREEEGAKVLLQPVDSGLELPRVIRTGITGAFDFRNVPSGRYRLAVIERGGLAPVDYRALAAGGDPYPTLDLTVADGDVVEEELRP